MSVPRVAYFCMEMAIDPSLKIYSGGLGFLAGSHMRSAYDLDLPMVGVSMLWTKAMVTSVLPMKTLLRSIMLTVPTRS